MCLKSLNFRAFPGGQSLSTFLIFSPLLTENLSKIQGSCSSFMPICAHFYSRTVLESSRKVCLESHNQVGLVCVRRKNFKSIWWPSDKRDVKTLFTIDWKKNLMLLADIKIKKKTPNKKTPLIYYGPIPSAPPLASSSDESLFLCFTRSLGRRKGIWERSGTEISKYI